MIHDDKMVTLNEVCDFQVSDAVHLTVHQFAESLSNVIDAKDHCTRSHSEEVAVVSQCLAIKMGLSSRQADILHVAGHLHDIGKIGVPDAILKKRGPLTDAEFRIIQQHPVIGAEIMAPVTSFAGSNGIVEMILHHHERFDGNGYPHGLRGGRIPLGARIIAVADSLSAMLQNRPYRKAMTFDQAAAEILACSGTQFDPHVVSAFSCARDSIKGYLDSMREVGAA